MLRAPMSLQKMTYDAATGTVIYRSKMHASLKRNYQVMSGVAGASLPHILDRYEHALWAPDRPLLPKTDVQKIGGVATLGRPPGWQPVCRKGKTVRVSLDLALTLTGY